MDTLKGKPNIGDDINNKIIGPLAHANRLCDFPDFNDAAKRGSGKELVDRLTNLIAIFANPALDFSKNRADGDDVLGDAYGYLMRPFATESGKSKGQFHTPAEVSRIMARVIGVQEAKTTSATTVYDHHLRLGLPVAESEGCGWHRRHPVWAGKGCRHQRSRPDEHDPALGSRTATAQPL